MSSTHPPLYIGKKACDQGAMPPCLAKVGSTHCEISSNWGNYCLPRGERIFIGKNKDGTRPRCNGQYKKINLEQPFYWEEKQLGNQWIKQKVYYKTCQDPKGQVENYNLNEFIACNQCADIKRKGDLQETPLCSRIITRMNKGRRKNRRR